MLSKLTGVSDMSIDISVPDQIILELNPLDSVEHKTQHQVYYDQIHESHAYADRSQDGYCCHADTYSICVEYANARAWLSASDAWYDNDRRWLPVGRSWYAHPRRCLRINDSGYYIYERRWLRECDLNPINYCPGDYVFSRAPLWC